MFTVYGYGLMGEVETWQQKLTKVFFMAFLSVDEHGLL